MILPLYPCLRSRLATVWQNTCESISTSTSGAAARIACTVWRIRQSSRGARISTSRSPLTERSLIGKIDLRPSPLSASPPTPTTLIGRWALRRRTRSAPMRSPDGSPATTNSLMGASAMLERQDRAAPRIRLANDRLALDQQRALGLEHDDRH